MKDRRDAGPTDPTMHHSHKRGGEQAQSPERETTMNPCDTYQAQLLHHTFGLLDEAEAADLQAHLRGCPACQAALARAQAQQRLLATAAKGEFPGVEFRRPAAGPVGAGVLALRP